MTASIKGCQLSEVSQFFCHDPDECDDKTANITQVSEFRCSNEISSGEGDSVLRASAAMEGRSRAYRDSVNSASQNAISLSAPRLNSET